MDYILAIIILCAGVYTLAYRLGVRRGRKESWMREYRRGYRMGYDRAREDLLLMKREPRGSAGK